MTTTQQLPVVEAAALHHLLGHQIGVRMDELSTFAAQYRVRSPKVACMHGYLTDFCEIDVCEI